MINREKFVNAIQKLGSTLEEFRNEIEILTDKVEELEHKIEILNNNNPLYELILRSFNDFILRNFLSHE